jgi:hypothetical protein
LSDATPPVQNAEHFIVLLGLPKIAIAVLQTFGELMFEHCTNIEHISIRRERAIAWTIPFKPVNRRSREL